MGIAAWRLVLCARYEHRLQIAVVLALALLISGLSPWRLGGALGQFHWVPFEVLASQDAKHAATVVLAKLFFYSALIWGLRGGGGGWLAATLAASVWIALIEVLQLFVRGGHVSGIGDPLLALMAGAGLAWVARLERAGAPAPRRRVRATAYR